MSKKTKYDSLHNKPPLVINEQGGSLSITNKLGSEKVNLSHIGGAAIEMTPVQTSIFSPENRTDKTNNDEYKTTGGDQTEFVQKTKSVSIGRNLVTTIGDAKAFLINAPQQYFNKWAEVAGPFIRGDVNRPRKYIVAGLPIDQYPEDRGDVVSIRMNSALQQLKDNFCNSLISTVDNPVVLNDFIVDFTELFTLIKEAIAALTGSIYNLIDDLISTSVQFVIDEFYEILNDLITQLKQMLLEVLCQFLTIPDQLVQFVNSYLNGIAAAVQSILAPLIKKQPQATEGNTYTQNDKSSLDEYLISKAPEMLQFESVMGVGGNETTNVLKNKMVNIGGGFNMSSPVSYDQYGTEVAAAPLIDKWMGTTTLTGGIPKIERSTINDACDVGNYTITVGNKFNLITGGGGMRLDTIGALDIQSPSVNIIGHGIDMKGDVVTVKGNSGIFFDSSNFLTLKAPFSIALDGNAHVTKNMVIQGGVYVNGELYTNHITAPLEMQETMEQENATGIFTPGALVSFLAVNNILTNDPLVWIPAGQLIEFIVPPDLLTVSLIDPITVKPHVHKFANVPLRLTKGTTVTTEGLGSFDMSNPLALGFNSAHSKFREEAQSVLSTEPATAYKISEGNKWDQALT